MRLIERLIPEEDPEEEDIRAIREEDEIVGEEELFRGSDGNELQDWIGKKRNG